MRLWGFFSDSPRMNRIRQLLKYAISGGISTVVTLVALYTLTHWLNVWYIFSTAISYLVGFFVSFTLQKFWTFRNNRRDVLFSQAALYFLIVVANLGVNTLGMYILVEKFHMWYILADILVLAFIACESFFLYQLVFKHK